MHKTCFKCKIELPFSQYINRIIKHSRVNWHPIFIRKKNHRGYSILLKSLFIRAMSTITSSEEKKIILYTKVYKLRFSTNICYDNEQHNNVIKMYYKSNVQTLCSRGIMFVPLATSLCKWIPPGKGKFWGKKTPTFFTVKSSQVWEALFAHPKFH